MTAGRILWVCPCNLRLGNIWRHKQTEPTSTERCSGRRTKCPWRQLQGWEDRLHHGGGHPRLQCWLPEHRSRAEGIGMWRIMYFNSHWCLSRFCPVKYICIWQGNHNTLLNTLSLSKLNSRNSFLFFFSIRFMKQRCLPTYLWLRGAKEEWTRGIPGSCRPWGQQK